MSGIGNPNLPNIGQYNAGQLAADQARNTLLGKIAVILEGLSPSSGGTSVYASRTVSSNYTLTTQDRVVYVDATAGSVTITLPDPGPLSTSGSGQVFTIKKIDSSVNPVTLSGYPVDGVNPYALVATYQAIEIQAASTVYYALSLS